MAEQSKPVWVFEPHGGYGQTIAGETMPFGYISDTAGPPAGIPSPIFALEPVHALPVEVLHAAALKMAAASEALTAGQEASDFIHAFFGPVSHDDPSGWSDDDARKVCEALDAAIAKATAQ